MVVLLGGLWMPAGAFAARPRATRVKGLVELGKGDDPFEHCRPIVTEGPERWKSYRCIYSVGRQHGIIPRAAEEIDEILAAHPDDAAALSIRASCAINLAEEGMLDRLRRAAEALEADGERAKAAFTLLQISALLFTSEPAAARRAQERGMQLAEQSGDAKAIAWVKVERARLLHQEGGDLDEVTRVLRETREFVYGSKDYTTRVNFLVLEQQVLRSLGQTEQALEVYQELLGLHRLVGDSYYQAQTLGRVLSELWTDRDRIRELFGVELPQALMWMRELAERSGNRWAELSAELMFGELRMGDAERRFARCLELAEQVGSDYQRSRCLAARAVLRLPHDQPAAFEDIEHAARFVDGLGIEHVWVEGTRVSMLWRVGPYERALAASLALLDQLEDTFRRHRAALTRALVRADYAPYYFYLADRVLGIGAAGPGRNDIDLALRMVERMRAQELLHALAARPRGLPVDDPRRRAHVAATREISRIQRQLLEDDVDDEQRASLMKQLSRAEDEERAAWAEVLRTDPTIARLERTTPPGLDELQAVLRDDEALLSFQLGAAVSWLGPQLETTTPRVIVVTRRSARAIELPPGEGLGALVDLFGGLFEARGGRERNPAAGLYQRLLADALGGLPPGIEHLVLVPDGPLHRLPFAALRAHPMGPPLVERYRLSQVPSLAVWHRLRRSAPDDHRGRTKGKAGALVLADPEVSGQGDTIARERAWALQEGLGLGRLPHAREEGEALVRYLGEGSELRVGESATEAGLKAGDVDAFSILHFASHAILDDEHPERSAVLLAPGSEVEDGLLQTREIARLDLHGALVVLSSCRSGSGTVVGGEGPVGLSRAFFEAGARTVVASLWRLRDDDAAAIFDAFYRHLRRGLSVSAALRLAQNERRRAGAPAAAWAGIVALGDGDFVPFPGGVSASTVGWWALGAVLLVAFGLGGLAGLGSWRRKRGTRRAAPPRSRGPSIERA